MRLSVPGFPRQTEKIGREEAGAGPQNLSLIKQMVRSTEIEEKYNDTYDDQE